MAAGSHPFPFRTRKLSPPAPMVLGGRPPGRVGRRRISHEKRAPRGVLFRVRMGPHVGSEQPVAPLRYSAAHGPSRSSRSTGPGRSTHRHRSPRGQGVNRRSLRCQAGSIREEGRAGEGSRRPLRRRQSGGHLEGRRGEGRRRTHARGEAGPRAPGRGRHAGGAACAATSRGRRPPDRPGDRAIPTGRTGTRPGATRDGRCSRAGRGARTSGPRPSRRTQGRQGRLGRPRRPGRAPGRR